MKTSIQSLMERSGVTFGTSGARGLATAMTDLVCFAYTRGFLQFLESIGEREGRTDTVAIAGDSRPSTGRIMEAISRAAESAGWSVANCGRIPSPAVALYGLEKRIPAIMVTGSHIPDDRNGIKFNKSSGEILKTDEKGMAGQVVELDEALFDSAGNFACPGSTLPCESAEAGGQYIARYLDVFGHDALKGMGQHSAPQFQHQNAHFEIGVLNRFLVKADTALQPGKRQPFVAHNPSMQVFTARWILLVENVVIAPDIKERDIQDRYDVLQVWRGHVAATDHKFAVTIPLEKIA